MRGNLNGLQKYQKSFLSVRMTSYIRFGPVSSRTVLLGVDVSLRREVVGISFKESSLNEVWAPVSRYFSPGETNASHVVNFLLFPHTKIPLEFTGRCRGHLMETQVRRLDLSTLLSAHQNYPRNLSFPGNMGPVAYIHHTGPSCRLGPRGVDTVFGPRVAVTRSLGFPLGLSALRGRTRSLFLCRGRVPPFVPSPLYPLLRPATARGTEREGERKEGRKQGGKKERKKILVSPFKRKEKGNSEPE